MAANTKRSSATAWNRQRIWSEPVIIHLQRNWNLLTGKEISHLLWNYVHTHNLRRYTSIHNLTSHLTTLTLSYYLNRISQALSSLHVFRINVVWISRPVLINRWICKFSCTATSYIINEAKNQQSLPSFYCEKHTETSENLSRIEQFK
jgi:hypothetical protein